MAQLKIYTDDASIDLLTGTLKLVNQSWKTRSTAVDGDYSYSTWGTTVEYDHHSVVVETMDLIGSGSHTEIRTAIGELIDLLVRQTRKWQTSQFQTGPVWLYAATDGGSYRKSLIYKASVQILNDIGYSPFMHYIGGGNKVRLRLSITRHPFWEGNASSLYGMDLGCNGGLWHVTEYAEMDGSVPARVRTLFIRNESTSPFDPNIARMWIGIRETRRENGDAIEFVPRWELEMASNLGPDTAVISDSGASGGQRVDVTFATVPEMEMRVRIMVSDVAPGLTITEYEQFLGTYLVLCRSRVSNSSTTCAIRLGSGYAGQQDDILSDAVYLDNTSWKLVPLGTVSIPPADYRGIVTDTPNINLVALSINCERVDGSGNLQLDNLVLIPTKYMATLDNMNLASQGGSRDSSARIYTLPNDAVAAVGYQDTSPYWDIEIGSAGLYVPEGDSLLVVAGERGDEHSLDDSVAMTAHCYPRWYLIQE